MAQNYTIVHLPGKSKFRIATVDIANPNDSDGLGVKSPEWMVKMDDMLKSSVNEEYGQYAELFGWHAQSSRFTTGDISNNLLTSASLKHSELILLIPNGGYAATLETTMNTGKKIDELTIVRLGDVQAKTVQLQKIVYKTCRIQSFQQQLDRLIVQLNVTSRENTIFVYDIMGTSTGQTVSKVDYSKSTAS